MKYIRFFFEKITHALNSGYFILLYTYIYIYILSQLNYKLPYFVNVLKNNAPSVGNFIKNKNSITALTFAFHVFFLYLFLLGVTSPVS